LFPEDHLGAGNEYFGVRHNQALLDDVLVHVDILLCEGRDELVVLVKSKGSDLYCQLISKSTEVNAAHVVHLSGDSRREQQGLTRLGRLLRKRLDDFDEFPAETLVEEPVSLIENERAYSSA
jgi:hypothetical protein